MLTSVTRNRIPRRQSANNFNRFDNDGQPTNYRVFKSQRWHRKSPKLQPGDEVLLREDNTNPLYCPTAVVTNIHLHMMAWYAWSQLGIPKGILNDLCQNVSPTACKSRKIVL